MSDGYRASDGPGGAARDLRVVRISSFKLTLAAIGQRGSPTVPVRCLCGGPG